jgi:hypothetical protein
METAAYYRAKVVELTALAEEAKSPEDRAHWRYMAKAWADLASRVDAEKRYFRDQESDD